MSDGRKERESLKNTQEYESSVFNVVTDGKETEILQKTVEQERSFMLSNLLNELPGGVALMSFEGKLQCQYYSDGFAKLSGRTREEVDQLFRDGIFLKTIVAPTDYEYFMREMRAGLAGDRPLNLTYRFVQKNADIGWIHLTAKKLREESGIPVYYCMFTVPSDEKFLYKSVVEDSAIGVFIADRATRSAIYSNDAFTQICGLEYKDIIGRTLDEFLPETGKKPLLTNQEIEDLQYGQYSEIHTTRNKRYLAIKAKALMWNGVDSYILYIADETKEHEHQLHLERLVNEVPTGIGIFEIRGEQLKLTYLNDAYYEMVGMNRGERTRFLGSQVMEGVYEEDRENAKALVSRLIEGESKGSVLIRIRYGHKKWNWINLTTSVAEREGDYLRIYASFADCDEMVRTHEEIKRTRIREQTLMESIPGGTAIYRTRKDGTSIVEYASQGYCRLLGCSREEVLSCKDIRAYVYPEDITTVEEAVTEAIQNHKSLNIVYRILTKDHQVVLCKLDAKIMNTEQLEEEDLVVLYAVHSRVSEESKRAMREQKYYRMILNMTGTAYFEWSPENGFYSSEEYEAYAISEGGYDALMGSREGIESIHPEDMPAVMYYMNEITNNREGKNITIRMKMKDGHYQWTEVFSYAERDEEGRFVKLVGVLRDVDKEWSAQKRRLQAALDEAEKANKAKTAFLSRVSHDMRTPLNGILGMTTFLKDSATSEQAMKDISQLEISGQYLLNLINDTLDVSRIENGKLELHPVVCDGKQILDNILRLARPNIEAKHMEFHVETKNLVFPMLYIDVGRVEQIIMNIIGNAVKFTPEYGRIDFIIENVSDTEDQVIDRVSIRDTGMGMSQEFLPTLFDPFSQADNKKTNSRQGTGLGMAITRQLVELMGGTITVESALGKGTCFTFTLPMKKANKEQILEWSSQNVSVGDDRLLMNKRILLCEDHGVNAQIARRLLQKKGMIVDWAENGQAGVERFAQSEVYTYDAILMDVRMPVMDGIDATRRIRRLHRADACRIPIIAMTGNSFEEDIQQTTDAGMNAHLSKPIDTQKLYETLMEQISTKQCYRRKKVLIVDDIKMNRAILREILEEDYEIMEADSGEEAWEIISEESVDVVITDLLMKKMDGITLTRKIRSCPQYDSTAIIINTQYGELAGESQAGVDGYLYKPNMPEKIKKQIGEALKKRSQTCTRS